MADTSKQTIHDKPQSMGGDVKWTDAASPSFQGRLEALQRDLEARVEGEVRFDSGSKAAYSTDASNYRQVPLGVVLPKTIDALVEAVAACHEHGAPITHRGAGTSLAGQTTNRAVIIDGSKYLDKVLEINPDEGWARVEPGVRRDELTNETEAKYNLTFAPDTSTHEYATFGGMIGNNACGIHSQMARRTQDNIEAMEVLLYDGTRMRVGPTSEDELAQIIDEGGRKGEIYRQLRDLRDRYAEEIRSRYPDIPRRVSGYNLTELLPENGFNVARALVGTEGTCVTVLEATVKLIHSPPERTLLVLGFEDIYTAGDHIPDINTFAPTALEGMDHKLLDYMQEKGLHTQFLPKLPEGQGFLIVEFGGDTNDEADAKARQAEQDVNDKGWAALVDTKVVRDDGEQQKIWAIRESGLGATAHLDKLGETWPGWEDSAIPPEAAGDYMRDLRDLYDTYGYDASLYGHFGQGCIHTRIPFDLRTAQGLEDYRAFIDEASDLCMQYGGSFSAEHGDGQARAELLPKMFGEALMDAFRQFKAIWDPDGKMNPGKVVDPRPLAEDLRLGTDYDSPELDTHFQFPDDHHSFSYAAMRCVGVGKCRRHDVGSEEVMCPSFLATHEEKHSTRGRSRLLFEMLRGDETPTDWQNEDVKEALDLCLACKGCKHDCPVQVDMATYKSEFLAHYYEKKQRPRHAYAFGLIYWWARLAAKFPKLANFFTQTPGLATVAKKIGGLAPERHMPAFAEETLRAWYQRRGTRRPDAPRVILWPDTFNNFFKPDTGKAAVEVMEAAGYQVVLPPRPLCCGRPLYDYGWIERAKRLWEETFEVLRAEIRSGTPLIGLEPSCVAAFRDELGNLYPNREDAHRLRQNTCTLAEFLTRDDVDFGPPSLERKVLLHGHCQHKSIMGLEAEKQLLDAMGTDYEIPPASCCGMAGAFGFEEGHYDLSIDVGEHALLPAVRDADDEVIVLTDGFSCREQIHQTTNRQALHLAEVLHMALRDEVPARRPEQPYIERHRAADEQRQSRQGMLRGLFHKAAHGLGALTAFFG